MIDTKTLQTFLKTSNFYTGIIDGIVGPKTYSGARAMLLANRVGAGAWPNDRVVIALTQLFLNKVNDARLLVDGLQGQRTNDAIYVYGTTQLHSISTYWPRQADVRSGKSIFGKPGTNQAMVQLPYPMYGGYDYKPKLTHFQAHAKVVPSLERIFERTLDYYGEAQIRKLRLDIFSGCYNYRATVGSSSLSMHSWGVAFDVDAAHNQMNESRSEAAFAKPVYAPFMGFFEEEGWVSLGRARNYDWMHFQAARL